MQNPNSAWQYHMNINYLKPCLCVQFAPGCTPVVFLAMSTMFYEFAGCKFAPTFEVVQIYLHPGANLLPGALCTHERKMFYCYSF